MSNDEKKSAVLSSLRSLDVNMTQLRERIQILSERLNPIMAPPLEPPEKEKEVKESVCEMCGTLDLLADQVLEIDEVVMGLIDRLEI